MRCALLLSLVFAGSASSAEELLRDGRRVVFLGDSNTYSGRFIAYLDAYLIAQAPERKVELINLGLPSETVTGLSEPDHPYPRPNVHDRLAAALEKTKPDIVVACYGMNDGIYYPFDEGRFQKYQDGYRILISACEKAGAKVVLMTPAPFDPAPLKDKVLPKDAEKYSWMKPYSGYDTEVLARYSEWLVGLRGKGYLVADAHTAVVQHLTRMRKVEPAYRVSGDGIHPDANGHFVIFREIAKVFSLSEDGVRASVDAAKGDSGDPAVSAIKVGLNKLEFTWKPLLPLPRDAGWHRRMSETDGLGPARLRLAFSGLPAGKHSLLEGDRVVGTATAEEWKKGVDVGEWRDLSVNARTSAFWKLIEEKNRVLGLAWLTDVGHMRPDTPKGIPLADAKKKAAELDAKARELAQPVAMKLRIVPAK
jgi:lysophospholipase L1-like esterase